MPEAGADGQAEVIGLDPWFVEIVVRETINKRLADIARDTDWENRGPASRVLARTLTSGTLSSRSQAVQLCVDHSIGMLWSTGGARWQFLPCPRSLLIPPAYFFINFIGAMCGQAAVY